MIRATLRTHLSRVECKLTNALPGPRTGVNYLGQGKERNGAWRGIIFM